jgi:predicted DNA-binding transcriptional regulator YafY
MARTQRLLDLLQELRGRRRPVTADALAAAIGVSVRTLYRDINELRAQGARIEGEAGFGYVLKPGFLLPPLMFTPEELDVILVGAAWVARRKDLAMAEAARATLAKIAAVLPEGTARALDVGGLLVSPLGDGPPVTIDPRAVRAALRRERKVAIIYTDAEGEITERVIWPVAIAVQDTTQLLAAWCEWRADYRHFRLDRIRSLTVLEERMPRRRGVMYREWREREKACVPVGGVEVEAAPRGMRDDVSPSADRLVAMAST